MGRNNNNGSPNVKKKPKKLSINRNRIRELNEDDTKDVAGASYQTYCGTCFSCSCPAPTFNGCTGNWC